MASLAVSLLFFPPAAHAGSYSVTYGGGTLSDQGDKDPGTSNYSISSNNSPSGSYGASGGDTADDFTDTFPADIGCSGPIKATFTWQPSYSNDLPPGSVIIEQQCSVSAGSDVIGTGEYDDGFGDSGSVSEPNNEGATATQYSAKSNPGTSFPVTCSPSADSGGVYGDAVAKVGYTAAVSPVTISLGGTLKDNNGNPILDSSGNQQILVGQGCGARLSGIPNGCTVSNYSWSVSGTTFQNWTPSTQGDQYANPPVPANPNASFYDPGPGIQTNPTYHWFWNDSAQKQETVTCTATVTPPTGQGSAFSVTATQNVTVYVPTLTNQNNAVGMGYIQPFQSNGQSGIEMIATDGAGGDGSIWTASVGNVRLIYNFVPLNEFPAWTQIITSGQHTTFN